MRPGYRYAVVGALSRAVLGSLFATVRYELVGPVDMRRRAIDGPPVLFVLWHGRLLPLAYLHRHQRIGALVSPSRDGEYLVRLLEGWGFQAARGSSTRGGEDGLRDILRMARRGQSLAVTPDGPLGPMQKLKPGVIVAAQRSGLPIVPVAAGADRAWWFVSWDRFLVPKPFARIRVAYGEPRVVPRGAGPEELERYRSEIELELNEMLRLVDDASASAMRGAPA